MGNNIQNPGHQEDYGQQIQTLGRASVQVHGPAGHRARLQQGQGTVGDAARLESQGILG